MKNNSLISKLLMAAVTLGIFAYFGIQVYRYMDDPMLTTLAYTYQVEDSVEISGCMVRQEQVLTGDGGGLMQLRRGEGERVSSGGAVATVYADQASLDRQNEIEALNRGDPKAGQPDRSVTAGLPVRRRGWAAGYGGGPRPGAALPGAEAGLHLFRH